MGRDYTNTGVHVGRFCAPQLIAYTCDMCCCFNVSITRKLCWLVEVLTSVLTVWQRHVPRDKCVFWGSSPRTHRCMKTAKIAYFLFTLWWYSIWVHIAMGHVMVIVLQLQWHAYQIAFFATVSKIEAAYVCVKLLSIKYHVWLAHFY